MQTGEAKERLFECTVQDQQKTLSIDHVVKMGMVGEAASGLNLRESKYTKEDSKNI